MYEFLALESRDVHLCERLRVLRSNICSTAITIFIKLTGFSADKKFKINLRRWK